MCTRPSATGFARAFRNSPSPAPMLETAVLQKIGPDILTAYEVQILRRRFAHLRARHAGDEPGERGDRRRHSERVAARAPSQGRARPSSRQPREQARRHHSSADGALESCWPRARRVRRARCLLSRAPGQQAAGGLAAEIERLKAERSAGMVILRLDPESIGLTEFANRHELSLSTNDETFRAFKENIRLHGQDTPVRVRPAAAGGQDSLTSSSRGIAAMPPSGSSTKRSEGGFPILARLDAKACRCQRFGPEDVSRERGARGPFSL